MINTRAGLSVKLRRSESLSGDPEKRATFAAFLLSSERLPGAGCCFIYRLSRSGWWLSGSLYNLDHHQGKTALLLPTVSGYISASALFLNPSWLAVISYSLHFCALTGQHHFGFRTVERLKYTRAVFMCVWCVRNGVRGVYFHFLGEKIWVFALSLAFNPSRRMERLFNSSITRKCPPKHQRSRAKAGEAGYPPTSISL